MVILFLVRKEMGNEEGQQADPLVRKEMGSEQGQKGCS